jgi:hypothetical protein
MSSGLTSFPPKNINQPVPGLMNNQHNQHLIMNKSNSMLAPSQVLLRTNSTTSSSNGVSQTRSSSSNPYNCDRFIPFRGSTSDNFYMEEFMLNNEDPFKKDTSKRVSVLQNPNQENQGINATPNVNHQIPFTGN